MGIPKQPGDKADLDGADLECIESHRLTDVDFLQSGQVEKAYRCLPKKTTLSSLFQKGNRCDFPFLEEQLGCLFFGRHR